MKPGETLKLPNIGARATLDFLSGGLFHRSLALTLSFLPTSTPSSFSKEGFLKEIREILDVELPPKAKLIMLEGSLDIPVIVYEMLLATLHDRNYIIIAKNNTDMRLPYMDKLNYLIQISSNNFCFVSCNEFWYAPDTLEEMRNSKLKIELPPNLPNSFRLCFDSSKIKVNRDELCELLVKSEQVWSVL